MDFEQFMTGFRFRIEAVEKVYRLYLSEGRTLLYARILRKHNSAIRDLAMENVHVFPPDRRGDLMDLIVHIDSWLLCWDQTHLKGPALTLDSKFVFESPVRFPREAVQRLLEPI